MQRSKPLIPFSHDHHHGLVVCRRVREGLKRNINPGRITAYVRDFWVKDLQHHFAEEERLIFPLLADDDVHLVQALSEHKLLRAYIMGLSEDEFDVLDAFAKALEEHIRFEERVLFPYIEQSVPKPLASISNSPSKESAEASHWGDEFWKG